ncbi:MAG: GNAT family N-acetyltransferase [Candidatus Hydrogenedentes bacterium]|nr:GNAT family N-acetyltransferase [Candidatus Hydrogenedentota bacterium]
MEPRDLPIELSTDRLALCRLARHHAEALFACVDANRDHLRQYMPWSRETRAVEDIMKFIEEVEGQCMQRLHFVWVLVRSDSGSVCGTMGLFNLDWHNQRAEVGYWISADSEGQGLISEALQAVVVAAFGHGLHRIELRCRTCNERSAAVARRNGFELEGQLRAVWKDEDRYYDALVFGRLRPQ